MKNLPILFIFDLDLTIIGVSQNINYYKYELLGGLLTKIANIRK